MDRLYRNSRLWVVAWAALMVVFSAKPAACQDAVTEALAWFPPGTVSLEYANPAALRGVPNYQALRERYLGRDLQRLEASLAKLGIQESDIQQLVLGWQVAPGNKFQFEGLAAGAFDPQAIARHAAQSDIAATRVDNHQAYCLAGSRTCIAVLAGSVGIFGRVPVLREMLHARDGQTPGASSDPGFTQLVTSARSDAAIWGVAQGQAVGKWFEIWMPAGKNVRMNWSSTFRDVRSLSYQIDAGSDVQLKVKLDCATPQAASSLRQLFQGLKLIQQLAWQHTNPSQPNPFQNLEVEAANTQVSFTLTADYAALEHMGPLGRP